MAEVSYVTCPKCRGRFSVAPEFFTVPESYCHCPYCSQEFSVYSETRSERKSMQSTKPRA